MKTGISRIALCVMVAFCMVAGGCRKKADDKPAQGQPGGSTKTSVAELGTRAVEKAAETTRKAADRAAGITEKAAETAGELKEKATEKAFSIVRQFETDSGRSIPEITADAKEMAVENLRRMAEKYRDVIAEKQQQLKEMTQKYIDLPDAERITAEGHKLKAGINEIKKGVDLLKERFTVYYNALKEKGGNLVGLDI